MKKLLFILVCCVLITPFVHSKANEKPFHNSTEKATIQIYDANFDDIDKESRDASTPTATNLIFVGIVIAGMASLFQNNIVKKK